MIQLLLLFALSFAAPRQDAWKVIGPGGGGAMYLPTVSPHSDKTVTLRCDMTGGYISQDGGDSWRMFNLRGVIRFFVYDPQDPKTIYAATNLLWRSRNSGKTWEMVWPKVTAVDMADDHADESYLTANGPAPHISALAVANGNLYAAVMEQGQSVLYVSKDGGSAWQKSDPLPAGVKAIYPGKADTLYVVGSGEVAVRKGGQWRTLAGLKDAQFIDVSGGFAADGALRLYATSRGSVNISKDGGENWTQYAAPENSRFHAVAASYKHPEVAYASFGGRSAFGVLKTTDGGQSWTPVWKTSRDEPTPNVDDCWLGPRFGVSWGDMPLHLGVSPNNPDLAFATNLGSTLRTRDGGKTWQGVYSKKVEGGGWSTTGLDVTTTYGVHFDPFDPKRQFIDYTDIGLFRSEDGGQSWISATDSGVPRRWVNTTYWMEFDPKVKGKAWAVMSGTHDLPRPKMFRRGGVARYQGGVAVTEDGGKTWKPSIEGMPPTGATHILMDPTSPAGARVLYVTGFGWGVFKSTDDGKTWTLKNKGIAGEEPFAWRMERDKDGVLYVIVARRSEDGSVGTPGDGALYRSRDGAESWEKVPLPEGANGPNGLAVDPKDPKRLYLACWRRKTADANGGGGVFVSSDAGQTWKQVLVKDQHVYDVTVDPRNPKVLYACGFSSAAWRSEDRGQTWKQIPGYNFKWGHRVVPDPNDASKIYITTFGGSVWHGPAKGDPKGVADLATQLP